MYMRQDTECWFPCSRFFTKWEIGDFHQLSVLVRVRVILARVKLLEEKIKQRYFHAEGGSIGYRHHPAHCKLVLGQQSYRSSRFLMERAVVHIREKCPDLLQNAAKLGI